MIRNTVNEFRDKPFSFLWAQAGDHPSVQDTFALNAGFPAVLAVNPMRSMFAVMRSSFSEDNLGTWLKDLLNRKGGQKFGRYHQDISFTTTAEPEAQQAGQIEISDSDDIPEEL